MDNHQGERVYTNPVIGVFSAFIRAPRRFMMDEGLLVQP